MNAKFIYPQQSFSLYVFIKANLTRKNNKKHLNLLTEISLQEVAKMSKMQNNLKKRNEIRSFQIEEHNSNLENGMPHIKNLYIFQGFVDFLEQF